MKRRRKSKMGFTLLEMVVVVAVIVILAGVMAMSISTYIASSKAKSESADSARHQAVVDISDMESRMSAIGFGNSSVQSIHTPSPAPASST